MIRFNTYIAAIIGEGNSQELPSLFAVHPDEPNRYHRNGGIAFCTLPLERVEVKKTYLIEEFNGDEEALELQFRRDFPFPPSPPRQSAGWIAPDGTFYSCSPHEYDSVALWLIAMHHNVHGNGDLLEQHGWLRLSNDGTLINVYRSRRGATQAQLNTCFDIAQQSSQAFRHTLIQYAEMLERI